MTGRSRARRVAQSVAALLLVLALATDVTAASWSYPGPVTTSGDVDEVRMVALPPSTVVLVYTDGLDGKVRRSTDGGVTWGSAKDIPGAWHWVSGFGTSVDLVWLASSRVRYARSTNGAVSFQPAVSLSSSADVAYFPVVARGPDNRVLVSWAAEGSSGWDVKVRVSTNGGASFAPAKTVASNVAGSPGVAVGKGVLYVSYRGGGLHIRRSTNSGATWSSPKMVAADAYGDPIHRVSMTASGSAAYVAYLAVKGGGPQPQWVRYVKTTDKGLSWSAPRDLSPGWDRPAYMLSNEPSISLQGGIARAVFSRCLDSACATTGVFYRQSSGGTTWTSAYPVSIPVDTPWAGSASVGFALHVVVGYQGCPELNVCEAYVRTRQ